MAKPKPDAPRIEAALFWAAVANLATKRAKQARIALELGGYKVTGSIKGEVFLGGRRKPRPVEGFSPATWSSRVRGQPQADRGPK